MNARAGENYTAATSPGPHLVTVRQAAVDDGNNMPREYRRLAPQF
jgi:hypothetical protein